MTRFSLLLLFILSTSTLIAQDNKFHEVVNIPSKSSEFLYKNAKEWFALNFKSAQDVIQLDDPNEKKIIGKASKVVYWKVKSVNCQAIVFYTLMVQFKDERYKYDIEPTEIKIPGGSSYAYDEMVYMGTEEGLKQQLKKTGSAWMFGKKMMAQSLESNKNIVRIIDSSLMETVTNLTNSLMKESKDSNW